MKQNHWTILGIDPTDDTRAIKRAYAAKLKAIDPDADPKSFIALRMARHTALGQPAEDSVAPVASPKDEQAVNDSQPVPQPARITNSPLKNSCSDISNLLWSSGAWTVAHETQLAKLADAFFKNPELEHLDVRKDVEAWVAHLIAETVPRSDSMIDAAITKFGWEVHDEDEDPLDAAWPEFVLDVIERKNDLNFRRELGDPSHHLYEAFRMLKRSHPEPISDQDAAAHGPNICALLNNIHLYYPSLTQELNQEHYQKWMSWFKPRFIGDDGQIEFGKRSMNDQFYADRRGCIAEFGMIAAFIVFFMLIIIVYSLIATMS
jgi:hypothetical protein